MKQMVRRNFEEKAAYFANSIPNMVVVDHGSFLLVDCGLPSDTLNVIVARDLSQPTRLLDEGVGYFIAKGYPMALWYWADELDISGDKSGVDTLITYDLAHNETVIAMYADQSHLNFKVTQPETLIIKYAQSATEIRQYGAVIAELFAESDEGPNMAAYYNLLSQYDMSRFPEMRHYIGIYDDQVVATGTLFIGRETVGIYDIVTSAQYRRRGIGSAMFAYLLNEAKSFPHRYVVLQASADGIGIYRKAGFIPAGEVHIFDNRTLL